MQREMEGSKGGWEEEEGGAVLVVEEEEVDLREEVESRGGR